MIWFFVGWIAPVIFNNDLSGKRYGAGEIPYLIEQEVLG
jgi:hypothetical protein